MLWEYKHKFSKDQKFETAVQERFCKADLEWVFKKVTLHPSGLEIIALHDILVLQNQFSHCGTRRHLSLLSSK